jgi:hypothetical protein
MTDFEELVAAERRKAEEQAAAERRLKAEEKAGKDAWASDELRAWQGTIDRIQELLATVVRSLTAEGVQPLPVLDHRKPRPLQEVNRTVVTGYRWEFDGAFALDKRCRVYRAVGARPLIPADQRPERGIGKRVNGHLRERGLVPGATTGAGPEKRIAKLVQKSLLRTGLAVDQPVLWCMTEKERDPIRLDPAQAVESGRIHRFGKTDDGTPLLLPADAGHQPERLEVFMARAVARALASRS